MPEKKKKINVRELVNKYQENCDRIGEIADACEKEKRERSKEETEEYEALARDNQMLQMRMQIATSNHLQEHPNAEQDADRLIRENAKRGQKSEVIFVRDLVMVGDATNGALIPLNIQDILEPLTEGFILDKVGLPMPTGLAGDYVWPMYEMVEAQIAGEGVELSDTKIPFSKMQATFDRVGIAIPVTNQTLNQTKGVVEMIVRKIMPLSIRLLLNKILFSTTKVNNATNLVGPFVGALSTVVALSKTPTFKDLNQMKAQVLETGIDGEALCWVMTKSMQAILEGEPINSKGVFLPIIQNGKMCGLPVYTTNCIRNSAVEYKKYDGTKMVWNDYTPQAKEVISKVVTGLTEKDALAKVTNPSDGDIYQVKINTEYIGLGDWRYQPMGLFGDIRFTVDPYSQARKDSVDFILNANYGTKTLRPEAFLLGQASD